ncbi:GNAT family N-acetyltransferase [Ancylobacter radicis]|uniref:GNAT family N-acetyltransferase n=1 Tax=Ancylobacter radicis TaxID=2836179 RepID=A0ABS5R390_9HYPH|nr:GNAT family protein [Ancylobacter radicis]MBS9476119.1 GNAT family N-acetyltransferase [Ancylobacter radicis]
MDAIRTERLVLRNFWPEDGPDLLAYLREPGASCYLSLKLDDLAAAEAEAAKRAGSDETIAVCLAATGRVIGDVFAMPEPPDTYAVGWNFNADVGGAGLATEAARALFDHLFTAKQARRLYAYVEEDNTPSRRLCERLGMRAEGLFREFISFREDEHGRPVFENTLQYALLRKEWQGPARAG